MSDGDVIQHTTTTILGRYRLIKQIGSGGMGDVWLGEDPRLHRQVAIKTLPVQKQQDNEFVLRFEREARAAAALNHPHILPVHDFGKQALPDGRVITYIVMPYITGGTLADRIATNHSRRVLMAQDEAIAYLVQAAEAIDYAHRYGIVHRDIKPGNMLLRSDNWLLLGDFGIARILSSTENLTRTGVAGTGTPEYMAPEQAQGRAEASSDIYSLAVLAYYLLTGRLPFQAETGYATSILHMTSSPPSPRTINPALSSSQESALLHGLAKQPAERPSSAGALIAEIQQATSASPHAVTRHVMLNQPVSGNAQTGNNQFPITGQSQAPMPVTQHSLASFPTKVERHTQVPGEINSALQPATKPRISRRTILIGGGTALVLLGGSAGTWAIMNTMRKQASTSKARTIPSPTPDPDGPDLILRGHTKPVTSLAWSLQTTTMLASVADDGTALLWQIKQSQQLAVRLSPIEKQSFQPSGPLQIAWSSDGKFLAIGNTGKGQPGTSSSIDMYTGDLQKTAPGYTTALLISDIPAIAGLEWQNQYLIALATQPSSAGKKQLQLNLWDPQQPQQQLLPVSIAGSLPTNRSNRSPLLQISPDASSLALEEAEGVVIGQIKPSGTTVQWQQQLGPAQPDGQIKAISWVSGGAALTALTTKNNKDFTLTYWNTQKEIEQDPITTNAIITTVAWNPAPTSNLIATGSLDGRVLIWKVGGNNIPAILSSNLNAAVIILSWSADGQWLAAGFNDKDASILVWNIQGRGI